MRRHSEEPQSHVTAERGNPMRRHSNDCPELICKVKVKRRTACKATVMQYLEMREQAKQERSVTRPCRGKAKPSTAKAMIRSAKLGKGEAVSSNERQRLGNTMYRKSKAATSNVPQRYTKVERRKVVHEHRTASTARARQ